MEEQLRAKPLAKSSVGRTIIVFAAITASSHICLGCLPRRRPPLHCSLNPVHLFCTLEVKDTLAVVHSLDPTNL